MSLSLKVQPSQLVSCNDHKITTTSLIIAEAFGKKHNHIIEKIQGLECSENFRSANFSAYPYIHPQNKQTYTAYEITKDGFMFLVMGFTGAKAAAWKEAFINAFNAMAEQLNAQKGQPVKQPEKLRDKRQALDKGIKSLVDALKRKGQPATYKDVWKLVHLKTGMPNIREATPEQIEAGIVFVSESLEMVLLPPPPKVIDEAILKLVKEHIVLIENAECHLLKLKQALDPVIDVLSEARYKTFDLKPYL